MEIIYKEIGETPLERLEKFRIEKQISKEVPMTYAGRLDPMAEGLLIILIGEECKEKQKYLNLDKEYEVEILYGVQTDSYDVLGLITHINLDKNDSKTDFNKHIGKFIQEYPKYSSKMIAMKGEYEDVPTKEVEIFNMTEVESRMTLGKDLASSVISKIEKVKGDFRQDETVEGWKDFGEKYGEDVFKVIKIKVYCSSGTYMRSLANREGGLALSIKRTKVGDFS